MSDKRLKKNLLKDEPAQKKLHAKPVIISDSKGRYLKLCVNPEKSPENDILWLYKGGASTFDRYLWLKQNLDKLMKRYGQLSFYIWTGTCDLTKRLQNKTSRSQFIHLQEHQMDRLTWHYRLISELLQQKGTKVTFLHLPFYSIEIWNKLKGHRNLSQFKPQDKTLSKSVNFVNKYIDSLNNELNTWSPKLNEDLTRSRKREGKAQRYSMNFKLLSDGVHPGSMLSRSWLKSICRKIEKDCM